MLKTGLQSATSLKPSNNNRENIPENPKKKERPTKKAKNTKARRDNTNITTSITSINTSTIIMSINITKRKSIKNNRLRPSRSRRSRVRKKPRVNPSRHPNLK